LLRNHTFINSVGCKYCRHHSTQRGEWGWGRRAMGRRKNTSL